MDGLNFLFHILFKYMKALIKKAVRLIALIFLFTLALMGGLAMMAPRRPEQDYDNEIKTELVEAEESDFSEEKT